MNSILAESLKIILGEKPLPYYVAGFVFSFLAILLSLYMHSKKRDKTSEATPIKYSWKFLLWDNTKRIVASLIVSFLFFRIFDLSDIKAMVGFGFFMAFGVDKVIQFLMERTDILNFLRMDRDNFKQNKNNNE